MNLIVARCRLFLCELNLHSLRKFAIAFAGGSVVLVGLSLYSSALPWWKERQEHNEKHLS